MRASYTQDGKPFKLTTDLVRARVPTLVFGQSRNNVEVMLKYLRERLVRQGAIPPRARSWATAVATCPRSGAHRAGPAGGEIRCVVATNALELGIDIGSLDAVVCAGYPGSIAALWQRFGRAGRRRNESSLCARRHRALPLDQYVARDPTTSDGAPIEHARIDPDNVEILVQHLKCAAFELPFESERGLRRRDAESHAMASATSRRHGVVLPRGGERDALPLGDRRLSREPRVAAQVSWDNFVIIDLAPTRPSPRWTSARRTRCCTSRPSTSTTPSSTRSSASTYENHKAFVRKVEPDYYTTAMTYTRVSVTQEDDAALLLPEHSGVSTEGISERARSDEPERAHAREDSSRGRKPESTPSRRPPVARSTDVLAVGLGEVSVIEKVVGYKKIKFNTHENVGYGDVRLPEMQMHTSSVWITFSEETVRSIASSDELVMAGSESGGFGSVPRATVVDAIRGIGNAVHTVAAVGLMCDPRDLGHVLGERTGEGELPQKGDADGAGFDPTIFVYDHIPGGVGLAPRLFADRELVLRRARALIEDCPCAGGCPACIGAALPAPPALGPGGAGRPQALLDPDLIRRPTEFDLKRVAIELLARVGVSRVH
jgi:DEAD/DEAH box helicase domain-containing protein